MKKLLLLFGAVCALTACHNDDDTPSTEASIVGNWGFMKNEVVSGKDRTKILSSYNPDDCEKKNSSILKENGEATNIIFSYENGVCEKDSEDSYTYVYDAQSKTLILTKKETGEVEAYKVLELSKSRLIVEDLETKDVNKDDVNDMSISYFIRK